jgi:hypothetical protein
VLKRKRSTFRKDRRRKHHHWRVTVYYGDGETFARLYIDLEKARNFAKRQKISRVVKTTRITHHAHQLMEKSLVRDRRVRSEA